LTLQLDSHPQPKLRRVGMGGYVSTRTTTAYLVPFPCPECPGQLALAPTISGEFDAANFAITCSNCAVEFPPGEILTLYPEIIDWIPDGYKPGSEKYGRGRTDHLIFGKNLGSNAEGINRNRQMRLAVEGANPDLKDTQEGAQNYYALKTRVGLFETKPMKSALEMTSRKIKKIEQARNIKIAEPLVDGISKLVRKGIENAENRRPTTSRERRIIVEGIMRRMELWP
jgi:hypothetical protein